MAYEFQWYIEGEVLYLQYFGDPKPEELHNFMMEINTYVTQGTRPLVHTIIDVSGVTRASTLVELAQAMRGYKPDARTGWMITVGEQDKLVKFAANVARQLLHMRQRSFPTMQEALDFLRDVDSGIDWSKANDRVLVSRNDLNT